MGHGKAQVTHVSREDSLTTQEVPGEGQQQVFTSLQVWEGEGLLLYHRGVTVHVFIFNNQVIKQKTKTRKPGGKLLQVVVILI